jgi:hypothetical protein
MATHHLTKKGPAGSADWESPHLRQAAVEYTLQQIGELPARPSSRPAYQLKLAPIAARLQVAPADLLLWLADKSLLPAYADRPSTSQRQTAAHSPLAAYETADVSSYDDALSTLASSSLHIPPGALPDTLRDPLSQLIAEEDGVLSNDERLELATLLESGSLLSKCERLAIACLLRGSELAGRRETVRAVLDWIVPPNGGEVTEIWELSQTDLTAPLGSTYRYEPLLHPLPGYGETGRCRLIIETPAGATYRIIPYCRVKGTSRTARSQEIRISRLRPVKRFARDHVLHQFALLASLVRQDERNGKEWADLFGVKSGKALVSYHKKKLVQRIQTATDSKVGFRNTRHKPDPRKGTKIDQPNLPL